MYILVSEVDGTLYTGQTSDVRQRLRRHNAGRIHSTKGHGPYRLGYVEECSTRAQAMSREWELKKKWNTERKRKLVSGFKIAKLKEFE